MPTNAKSTKWQKANGLNSVKRMDEISLSNNELASTHIAKVVLSNNKQRIKKFVRLLKKGRLRLPVSSAIGEPAETVQR